MQSTYFSGFSAGLHHKNNPVAVNGILYSGGLAALFARLEFAELLYLQRIAGKSLGYASRQSSRPTSLHRRGKGPSRSCIPYLQDLPLFTPSL